MNSRQTHIPSSSLNIQNVHALSAYQTQNGSDSIGGTSATSTTQSSPAPLASADDWSAYLDESKGLLYYFNHRTGKSQWEPPANVVFPNISMSADKKMEMRAQLKSYLKERLNDSSKDDKPNIIDTMEQERKRIEQKRREATEKLNAKMSKLEALKMQQQQQQMQEQQKLQQQQMQSTNNSVTESASTASTTEQPTEKNEQQQPKETEDTKPTSLPIVQQAEWSAYYDIKSGLVFYYNEKTRVSLWDPPSKDFPRVIMENNTPKVLDPRTSNISMERALTMTMEEDEAKRKWEEAKQKEKARKAKLRAEKAAAAAAETAQATENNNAQKQRELAAEQKRRSEEALKLQIEEEEKEKAAAAEKIAAAEQQRLDSERIAEQEKKQKEEEEARAMVQAKYEAAKAAELRRLEKERIERDRKLAEAQVLLDKERLDKERAAAAAAAKKKKEEEERKATEQAQAAKQAAAAETTTKQPSRPTEEPSFTVDNVENMVAPLKATDTSTSATLYDILNCSPSATRSELKRAYITLAKETHPDALLQAGLQTDEIIPDKFVEISNAWKILGDSTSRRRYDREMRAKGVSSMAGSIFENWVMGAAKKMDEALTKAEGKLDS